MIELQRTGEHYAAIRDGLVIGTVSKDPYFPWVFRWPRGRTIILIADTLDDMREQIERECKRRSQHDQNTT